MTQPTQHLPKAGATLQTALLALGLQGRAWSYIKPCCIMLTLQYATKESVRGHGGQVGPREATCSPVAMGNQCIAFTRVYASVHVL